MVLKVIAALDLADEKFRNVPSPCPGSVDGYEDQLGVLQGCLCVLVRRRDGWGDVWVMKVYGFRDFAGGPLHFWKPSFLPTTDKVFCHLRFAQSQQCDQQIYITLLLDGH